VQRRAEDEWLRAVQALVELNRAERKN